MQWGWATGIHTVRPKLVKKRNLPRSVNRARNQEPEAEGSCLETVESGKERQASDPDQEEALNCFKEESKCGGSCQATVESGKLRQLALDPVQEEAVEC